ncbi:hypothetical protein Syn7502_02765 [Synechococcus sp. PCC 7502]|uniref:hypothetical protein n=1 Tax=Synechococcus sp. PCC 7502 TaxID=1173263 RepID=UPI00029FE373|nr:hypothetical protein [Synechococcus sp. PCC 7502]AFY74703.1 hypothetical protein Syn7502_02765 [Synechococcus sp. PCC 7502]
MKKIIYLMYSDNEQLKLWMQYLSSPDLELVVVEPVNDLVQLLEQLPIDNLPSLILLDMSIQCPNSNLLQASKVGRWVKENQLSIKIILQTVRSEAEVTTVEQRWAEKQGAYCLLPMLSPKTANSQVSQIYEHLNLVIPESISGKIVDSIPDMGTEEDLDHEKLLIRVKEFYATINKFQGLLQVNKQTMDTYAASKQIRTHLSGLDNAIQDCISAISLDIQREKRRKLGEKFARLNRNSTGIRSVPTGINSGRSALIDFMVE